MTLIRIGEKGINLAHVVRWTTSEEDAGGRKSAVISIEYVNGESDRFTNEEAVALRRELDQQSSDIMSSPSGGIYP